MKRRIATWLVVVLALALSAGTAWTQQAGCSATFTSNASGTFPQMLKFDRQTNLLTVDLSGIPAGAEVFRAEVVLNGMVQFYKRPTAPTKVYVDGQPDKPLKFVAPRFVSLDALEAVRAAVKDRKPLTLKVETTLRGVSHLEVSYTGGKPKAANIPAVSGVKVGHRAGQSLVVFTEPKLAEFPEFKTGADVGAFRKTLLEQHKGLSFRIWRSGEKITPATIAKARLVGECGLMTCWNDSYHQGDTGKAAPIRYRVTDGGDEVGWDKGIYAHNPDQAGKAFYAVTACLNGEEDFAALSDGNTTAQAVEETVGLGEPILQWKETPKQWMYRSGTDETPIVRLIYTRWESWPDCSTPDKPIDYLVAIPPVKVEPAPVGLHLHCWGGSLNGGYGWWYNAHKGAIMIASNQVPYDWWTGYHEANGTCKTFGDGHVQPFSMNRTFAFLDWATTQWKDAPEPVRKDWRKLDLTRVFTAGSSMGGAGAPMFAVRYGQRVAWCVAWVGVHIPEETPQFKGSYEGSYGPRDEAITMPDGKTSPWDHFCDPFFLRQNPKAETGFIMASNGKDDGGIGWPQAVKFARALQETRRPHLFNWSLGGHGVRTVIEANFDLDLRTDQSLPAFTNGTLDNLVGTGMAKPKEQIEAEKASQEEEVKAGKRKGVAIDPYDGDTSGTYNGHLWWETDSIVDTPQAWEMTVILQAKAPKDECKVDLTPRRLQKFQTASGSKFTYTVTDLQTNKELGKGQATADELDLLTLKQIPLVKGKNRVKIVPAK